MVKVGGTTAIVCGSPKKPKKCCECKKANGSRLCDWKLGGGKTCDKPLCDVCARAPAHKKDLCEEHWTMFLVWKARMEAKAKEAAK